MSELEETLKVIEEYSMFLIKRRDNTSLANRILSLIAQIREMQSCLDAKDKELNYIATEDFPDKASTWRMYQDSCSKAVSLKPKVLL